MSRAAKRHQCVCFIRSMSFRQWKIVHSITWCMPFIELDGLPSNGLGISGAATNRSGRRLSIFSYQNRLDLVDAKRRPLHARVGRH